MGSGNRVEELESRVRQLEASVTGLTDELVECKERLRALEEEVEPERDVDIIEGQATTQREESEASKPDEDKKNESRDSNRDEIIVA